MPKRYLNTKSVAFDRKKAEIVDIKDNSPNKQLIAQIEKLLISARSGEIRTAVWLLGWDDDHVGHGWTVDYRTSQRRMLAEMIIISHDFTVNIGLGEQDSVLFNAFKKIEK